MQLSSLKALPSRPRLPARHLSPGLIACAVATLLVLPVARADPASPLSLDEALRLASDRSAQIAAQRSAIDSAQQASVSARQLPDPKLFFGVENLPVNTSESFSLTQDFMTMRKIGLMQDFPRSEKRDLKGKLAEQVAAREQSMLGDVQLALRRDVAGAWIERYFAQRMASVVDEQIAEVQLQADAMQAGLASGKTQPAELLAVQLNLQAPMRQPGRWRRSRYRPCRRTGAHWPTTSFTTRTCNRSSTRFRPHRRTLHWLRRRSSPTGVWNLPTRSVDRASPT